MAQVDVSGTAETVPVGCIMPKLSTSKEFWGRGVPRTTQVK